MLSLILALSLTTPVEAPAATLVDEIDLTSGDSPLLAADTVNGLALTHEADEQVFQTWSLLRSKGSKIQLLLPHHRVANVGHISSEGRVELCRGWMGESICQAVLKRDLLEGHAQIEIRIPHPDGRIVATFPQVQQEL